MSDETEYAMKYARERRMRIGLENRLHGLMYELVPYVSETMRMCHGTVTKDSTAMAQAMANIVKWQGDIEINILLNLLKPAGKLKGVSKETMRGCNNFGDIPDDELVRLEHATKACADVTEAEWDKLAAERGYASVEEYNQNHFQAIVEATMEAMKKQGMKPRSHV